MSENCPICNNPVPSFQPVHDETKCKVCGTFLAKEAFLLDLHTRGLYQNANPEVSYLLSGVVREKAETGIVPVLGDLDELQTQVPFKNDPLASINRILLFIYDKSSSFAEYLLLRSETDYPIGYARDSTDFEFFLDKAVELGYLETNRPRMSVVGEYRLSIKGWEHVANLRL